MWYHYEVDFFTFVICSHPDEEGHWLLVINDHNLGTYKSPDDAAAAAHNQHTGFNAWDFKVNVSVPIHLEDWKQGPPSPYEVQ
ncbi:MAG: hypothetical protein WBV94_02385 [Blastocatellia bacterium]